MIVITGRGVSSNVTLCILMKYFTLDSLSDSYDMVTHSADVDGTIPIPMVEMSTSKSYKHIALRFMYVFV